MTRGRPARQRTGPFVLHTPGWSCRCLHKGGGYLRRPWYNSPVSRNLEGIQMKYKKTVVLKNNEECLIRNAGGSDAKEVHDNFNLTHSETDFLLSYPDENSFDIEQERHFLIEKENSDNEIEICAIIGGRIIGTAGIEAVGKKDKVKHRAEFGISIEKEYWGLGIGRALIVACIECAKCAGYAQLELDVVSENRNAIALYKSVGFGEYGRNPKGFCSRSIGWQEVILMRMELD